MHASITTRTSLKFLSAIKGVGVLDRGTVREGKYFTFCNLHAVNFVGVLGGGGKRFMRQTSFFFFKSSNSSPRKSDEQTHKCFPVDACTRLSLQRFHALRTCHLLSLCQCGSSQNKRLDLSRTRTSIRNLTWFGRDQNTCFVRASKIKGHTICTGSRTQSSPGLGEAALEPSTC